MKKQLVLIALAGGVFAMAAPKAHAGAANTVFTNTGSFNQADSFNVSGTIPEFIQLTNVDNQLELGDLGSPTATGPIATVTRAQTTDPLTKGTSATPSFNTAGGTQEDGTAQIQLQSNTYVQVTSVLPTALVNGTGTGNPPFGTGANNAPVANTIPVAFRFAVKGKVAFGNSSDPYTVYPGGNTDSQNFATYSPILPTGANVNGIDITFAPYAPGSGAGVTAPSTLAPSGFKLAAIVTRNGLNDLRGTYSATVPLSYTKF